MYRGFVIYLFLMFIHLHGLM